MKVMTMILSFAVVCALIACTDNPVVTEQERKAPVSKADTLINFTNETVGKLPGDFKGFNNCGQAVNWSVIDEGDNKVMKQQAQNESSCYNVLIMQRNSYQNFTANVKIKAIAGDEDQGGGLIWRCQNEKNYYLARYNPLENNFRFYKVVNGDRKQLKSFDGNIKSGEWFNMTITMIGNKITCLLNGDKLIETTDDTFANAGALGMWTKSDAQSYFDDLSVQVSK
ncbi:MAG TPA: family 16 glycoside hydrolase [Bacteroidia bacterium]|nr:family 16 glycoside hydrolase [Bacteroidia bacterium]